MANVILCKEKKKSVIKNKTNNIDASKSERVGALGLL